MNIRYPIYEGVYRILTFIRGHYRLLRNKVGRTEDVEDLKRYFGDIARYHRERLADGTPAGSGAHPMADTCRALSLECSRQVLKDCWNSRVSFPLDSRNRT